MECREVRELADAFIADELLVETNQEILRHLESCPDCRAEIAARRALRSRLKSAFAGAADLAPREEWLSEVRTRLQVESQSARRSWNSPATWLALAATVLLAALRRIPGQYQDVILMCDVQELSYKEIAAALGIPIGTVMSRLHRGRDLLRIELAGYRGGVSRQAADLG